MHLDQLFELTNSACEPTHCLLFKGNKVLLSLHKHIFKTNKLTMFLQTEAAFPYCNWSIKKARIIWFGSTSVDIGPANVNNWKRLGWLPFWVYVKFGNSLKQKYILYLASKRKINARKYLTKIWCKYGLHQYLPQAQQYMVPLWAVLWWMDGEWSKG